MLKTDLCREDLDLEIETELAASQPLFETSPVKPSKEATPYDTNTFPAP